MKIENNPNNQAAVHRTEGNQAVHAAGKTQATEKSKRQDHAELSEQARLLSQAHTTLEALPSDEAREARVQELRSQIEAGTYNVPVRSLARKLLERLTNHGQE